MTDTAGHRHRQLDVVGDEVFECKQLFVSEQLGDMQALDSRLQCGELLVGDRWCSRRSGQLSLDQPLLMDQGLLLLLLLNFCLHLDILCFRLCLHLFSLMLHLLALLLHLGLHLLLLLFDLIPLEH